MIDEIAIVFSTLKKLNTILGVDIVTSEEMRAKAKEVEDLCNNVKEFQHIMNNASGANPLNEVILEKISGCLKKIIENLQNIEMLIHIAGRRHVENMEYGGELEAENNEIN
jgi:archaellum component FlaC